MTDVEAGDIREVIDRMMDDLKAEITSTITSEMKRMNEAIDAKLDNELKPIRERQDQIDKEQKSILDRLAAGSNRHNELLVMLTGQVDQNTQTQKALENMANNQKQLMASVDMLVTAMGSMEKRTSLVEDDVRESRAARQRIHDRINTLTEKDFERHQLSVEALNEIKDAVKRNSESSDKNYDLIIETNTANKEILKGQEQILPLMKVLNGIANQFKSKPKAAMWMGLAGLFIQGDNIVPAAVETGSKVIQDSPGNVEYALGGMVVIAVGGLIGRLFKRKTEELEQQNMKE